MRKRISVQNLKRLPEGTDVLYVEEATGRAARMWIAKTYKGRKLLKGVFTSRNLSEVEEKPGWHFEVER